MPGSDERRCEETRFPVAANVVGHNKTVSLHAPRHTRTVARHGHTWPAYANEI